MSPTEKQIALVEDICRVLGITNFPMSSKEFNKIAYSKFISRYLLEYQNALCNNYDDEEWLNWMGMDVWTPDWAY